MHGTRSTSIRHPRTLTCVPRIACIPPASLDHDCFTLVPRDQTQAVDLRANSNGQRSEWVRALMRLCGVRVLEQRTADGKSTEEAVLSARQSMASSIGGGSSVHEFTDADACVQWMNPRASVPCARCPCHVVAAAAHLLMCVALLWVWFIRRFGEGVHPDPSADGRRRRSSRNDPERAERIARARRAAQEERARLAAEREAWEREHAQDGDRPGVEDGSGSDTRSTSPGNARRPRQGSVAVDPADFPTITEGCALPRLLPVAHVCARM